MVNASALGRIAVLIAGRSDKLRFFLRLHKYLFYLSDAGKNSFRTDNVLIVTKEQFENAIDEV